MLLTAGHRTDPLEALTAIPRAGFRRQNPQGGNWTEVKEERGEKNKKKIPIVRCEGSSFPVEL